MARCKHGREISFLVCEDGEDIGIEARGCWQCGFEPRGAVLVTRTDQLSASFGECLVSLTLHGVMKNDVR